MAATTTSAANVNLRTQIAIQTVLQTIRLDVFAYRCLAPVVVGGALSSWLQLLARLLIHSFRPFIQTTSFSGAESERANQTTTTTRGHTSARTQIDEWMARVRRREQKRQKVARSHERFKWAIDNAIPILMSQPASQPVCARLTRGLWVANFSAPLLSSAGLPITSFILPA